MSDEKKALLMPSPAPTTKAWADLAVGDRVFLSLPTGRGTINAVRGFADAEFLIVFDANRPDEWVERWRVTPEGRGDDEAPRAADSSGPATGVDYAARALVRGELRAGAYQTIGIMRKYAERSLEAAKVRLRAIDAVEAERK